MQTEEDSTVSIKTAIGRNSDDTRVSTDEVNASRVAFITCEVCLIVGEDSFDEFL